MNMLEQIKRLARESGALYIQRKPDYYDYAMWELVFSEPDEPTLSIGYPQILAVKGTQIKSLSPDDFFKYSGYLQSQYEHDEEGDIIGFESELIKV